MKFKKIVFLLLVSAGLLYGGQITPSTLMIGTAVVPNDKEYFKHHENNVEIIYTKENLPFAKYTAGVEDALHKEYAKLYDWKLDETLYVGLMSDYNQIANGFSTQWPNNRQINYIGGTQMVDYFACTSWLDTLLYHETAHNYQMNIKAHGASRELHSIFGNGTFVLPLAYFIVPNVMENSFMLEGNAVLNESWHANGGRLYSGRFYVQTLLQAKAGNLKAGEVYNTKLAFPYGDISYIQGGYYNLYMAQNYGLENVNSYFKYHSYDFWWPEFTNESMYKAVGVDFETSLESFSKEYAQTAKNVVLAEGKKVAVSQFFESLGNNENEIFFLTYESGARAPELIVMEKNSSNIAKQRDSFLGGKVLKVDGQYYTQGSMNVSPTRIYQGLFDNQAFIKKGSESKVIQGYLHNASEVYFDVKSSFSQPQLYVGDTFYAQVNSSVIIDKEDNLYYFVQKNKTRTLYKNKTPLYSFQGYYGIVSDVDSKGNIYFVANSEYGSSLYRFHEGSVTRVSSADNIIEARLVNDEEVLLAAIDDKEYYYLKTKLQSLEQTPFETKLFFEDMPYYKKDSEDNKTQQSYASVDLSDSYYALLDMHYSGSDLTASFGGASSTGSLDIKFGDPLSQNAATVFVSKDASEITLGGVSYSNAQYLLQYSVTGYKVLSDNARENVRDKGVIVSTNLPLYQAGYYSVSLGGDYYQDYDTKKREPLSGTLTFAEEEIYGKSMYPNYLNMLILYGVKERTDGLYGAQYSLKHDFAYEIYAGLDAKYSATNSEISSLDASLEQRGVKFTNNSYFLDKDPSTIHMPSLQGSYYLKKAGYGEINVAKVLNYSSYWFTFPLSLQRESLYAKYRQYRIENFESIKFRANESTLGVSFSSVFLNSFTLPLNIEYIYNDADFLQDKHHVFINLGMTF